MADDSNKFNIGVNLCAARLSQKSKPESQTCNSGHNADETLINNESKINYIRDGLL